MGLWTRPSSPRSGSGRGFFAALDQSGGSTPKALAEYGIDESRYSTTDEMFDLVQAMRARIITSPAFDGSRILGAILFEQTMDRDVAGRPTAAYLWDAKQIVPFLKVDAGLADEQDARAADEADHRLSTTCLDGRSSTASSAPRCDR